MYPNVIFLDITNDKNIEGRPFFSINSKDIYGKMYTVLRAYLPNEKAWRFQWIFSIVIPQFFSKETLGKIRFVCSDGDSQEYTQLDNDIKNIFPEYLVVDVDGTLFMVHGKNLDL